MHLQPLLGLLPVLRLQAMRLKCNVSIPLLAWTLDKAKSKKQLEQLDWQAIFAGARLLGREQPLLMGWLRGRATAAGAKVQHK